MGPRALRFVIKAQAETAAAFSTVNRQIGSLTGQIAALNRGALTVPRLVQSIVGSLGILFSAVTGGLGRSIATVGAGVGALTAYVTGSGRAGANAARAMSHLGGVIQGLGGLISGLFGIFGSLLSVGVHVFMEIGKAVLFVVGTILDKFVGAISKGIAITAALGVAISVMAAKAGLDFDSFKEQTLVSFGVLFKSTDEAGRRFQELKHFADITPFSTKETIEAGKILASYGLDMQKYLTVAGNMSAAFNKPLEQAVHLLGRLQAGIFQTRSMAEFGLTRTRLATMGVQFKPSGEPVNRAGLLEAVAKVVQRDFGGMMETQARTASGLQERVMSFIEETFPGAIMEGAHNARKGALLILANFIEAFKDTSTHNRIAAALGQIFNIFGNLALSASRNVPVLVRMFDQFIQSGKWDQITSTLNRLFTDAFNGMITGLSWVLNNWDQIWSTIGAITVNVVKVMGGLLAGMINIFVEWVNGAGNMQTAMINLGITIKQQTLSAANTFLHWLKVILLVQAGLAGVSIVVGAIFKHVPTVIGGITQLITAITLLYGLGKVKGDVLGGIANFDPAKMTEQFQKMGTQPGPVGAFVRGYQGFGASVDNYLANFKGLPVTTPAGIGTPGVGGGGVFSPGDSDLYAAMLKDQKDVVDIREEEVKAWGQILKASEGYAAIMSNGKQAMQMQVTAAMGQLGALNRLQGSQITLLNMYKAGSEEWWKTLGAINKTADGINDSREKVRQLLFDVSKLSEQTGLLEKIFSLGKEVGFSPGDMQALAGQQMQLLTDTLLMERAKLATMTAGTTEWYKQKGAIVDIIGKMVTLKKELTDANLKIAGPMLMNPRTPFGMRGAAFGPESVRGGAQGLMANTIKDLLNYALNPRQVNLDRIAAQGMFPTGAEGSPTGAATYTAQAQANINAFAPYLNSIIGLLGGTTPSAPAGSQPHHAIPSRNSGFRRRDMIPDYPYGSGSVTWAGSEKDKWALAGAMGGLKGSLVSNNLGDFLRALDPTKPTPGMSSFQSNVRAQYPWNNPENQIRLSPMYAPSPSMTGNPGNPNPGIPDRFIPHFTDIRNHPWFKPGPSMSGMGGNVNPSFNWNNPWMNDPAFAKPTFTSPAGTVKGGVMGPPRPDMSIAPPHIWPGQDLSSVRNAPTVQTPAFNPDIWDFWRESLRRNDMLGMPVMTPGVPFKDNELAREQYRAANVRKYYGGDGGSGGGVNLNIPITINGELDTAAIRREAKRIFDQELETKLDQINRMRKNRGG